MGYFSNGTEAYLWQRENCYTCCHNDIEGGCPITNAHLMYQNSIDSSTAAYILALFVPRIKAGNGPCAMKQKVVEWYR